MKGARQVPTSRSRFHAWAENPWRNSCEPGCNVAAVFDSISSPQEVILRLSDPRAPDWKAVRGLCAPDLFDCRVVSTVLHRACVLWNPAGAVPGPAKEFEAPALFFAQLQKVRKSPGGAIHVSFINDALVASLIEGHIMNSENSTYHDEYYLTMLCEPRVSRRSRSCLLWQISKSLELSWDYCSAY